MLAGLLFEVTGSAGFALPGEFLLALPQKKPKGLAPSSGPALRAGSAHSIAAPRAGLQGPSWPFKPLAASLRLVPLHNTCARPSDGESARLMISSANPHGAVGKPRLSEGKTRAVRAVIPRADGNHELQSPQQTLYRKTIDRAEIRSRQEAEWNRCVRG